MSDPVKLDFKALDTDFDDGALGVAFDLAFKQIVKDCMDRPMLDKDRKITICVVARPNPDTHAPTITADNIYVQSSIKVSVPEKKTNVIIARTKQDGSAIFHPALRDDPTGDALYDDDVRERERGKGRKSPEE